MTLIELLIWIAIVASAGLALAGFGLMVLATYGLLAVLAWVGMLLRRDPTCVCGEKLRFEVVPKTASELPRQYYICRCGRSLVHESECGAAVLVDHGGLVHWARSAGRWRDHSVF